MKGGKSRGAGDKRGTCVIRPLYHGWGEGEMKLRKGGLKKTGATN